MTSSRPSPLRRLWHWFGTTPAQDFDEFLAGDKLTPRHTSQPHPDADPEACARGCLSHVPDDAPESIPAAGFVYIGFAAAALACVAAGWLLRGWWGG